MVAQIAVGKTPGQQTKHQQRTQQRLHGHIGEAQTAGPLPIDLDRFIDPTERVFATAQSWLMRWTSRETSVGLKADLAARREDFDSRLPMPKSRVSLMVVSVRRARPSL